MLISQELHDRIAAYLREAMAGLTPLEAVARIDGMLAGEEPLPAELQVGDADLTGVNALLLAEKGKRLWQSGRRAEAISAYEQGAILDPQGPAALLLEHSNEIMKFFNPDLLNP